MNIAVYLGASVGRNPIYRDKIKELGAWIGRNHHRLIYGGSKVGLMGVLAESALENGGEVIGVEPEFFVDAELQLDGLTELIVTADMQERKAKMIELSDMFIAFPGGTGTAEEISEVISAGSLGILDKVYGYYNVNGFYDDVKAQYDLMVREGFLSEQNRAKIQFWESLDEIIESIHI